MADRRYTVVILAASRGTLDPLAQAGGVSHKAFIDIAGRPMLARVVEAVLESGRVGRVIISIEEESRNEAVALLADIEGAADFDYAPSQHNIGSSIAAVAEAYPDTLPFIVTTADNALHTPEIVRHFCDALDDCPADCAAGVTPAELILEKYPDGQRAFHRFRDGAFSGCNLYAILTRKGLRAPRIFNSGGQFGKKPWRLIFGAGPIVFLLYKSRLLTLDALARFVSFALRVNFAPVFIPYAEGPIDVDGMKDWELATRIVAAREACEA